MRGILLAGGLGNRLFPLTRGTSKQLLSVYDKPMIYYPLSTLILAGISEILVITTLEDHANVKRLLMDGAQLGIKIEYAIQETPNGISASLLLAPEHFRNDDICLILGDNFFYGTGLGRALNSINQKPLDSATIFAYKVKNPESYGVIRFEQGKPVDIIEKPKEFVSPFAIPGLYFLPKSSFRVASTLTPSARGELEITDLLKFYLKSDLLKVEILERGTAWMDMGTPVDLMRTSNFVEAIESRQGLKIGSPEEISLEKGFLSREEFVRLAGAMPESEYKNYLYRVVGEMNIA
jgi:glucose-1-phosphate thymidylyltransferase